MRLTQLCGESNLSTWALKKRNKEVRDADTLLTQDVCPGHKAVSDIGASRVEVQSELSSWSSMSQLYAYCIVRAAAVCATSKKHKYAIQNTPTDFETREPEVQKC